MITQADFRDFTLLRHGSRSGIYAGRLVKDDRPVILKVLESDTAPLEQIARLENEYRLSRVLDLPCFRRALELTRFEDRPALLLEDPGGRPLKAWTGSLKLRSSRDFIVVLQTAIAVTRALAELHERDIIHKDINSNNILVIGSGPQDKDVSWSDVLVEGEPARIVLIDFGLSTRIEYKKQQLENPGRLEGTLGFISPEQTGRMNRSIDHRSDLYSLGITFFEMFTGRLPFQSDDPMELVHAHIARTPPLAHECNKRLPPVLSDIIARLLAKNAEARYQSARGLLEDLRTLLDLGRQVERSSHIRAFPLARGDHAFRLRVSERLYGREEQQARLTEAYEEICNGQRGLFAIGGAGGIGKSALVREIYRELKLTDTARSFFISGKFDQLKRNVPYSAWSQTLADLGAQLLGTGDEELVEWRARIRAALGGNAGVLTSLAGELQVLTGPVAHVPPLEGAEARNRLHYTLRTFFRAVCSEQNPLVFFIDDLQGADLGSPEQLSAQVRRLPDACLAEMDAAESAGENLSARLLNGNFHFKFAHDRVQQAAYFYIPEEKRHFSFFAKLLSNSTGFAGVRGMANRIRAGPGAARRGRPGRGLHA